ncbi:MAG: response regulator, partial [Anaerolineales bacterium]|nr:response regulator [Anaerolineales bacterium]
MTDASASNPSTLLIVDDDPVVREAIGVFLQDAGYRLVFAEDGAQALRLAEAARPDVIVLDVMLPGLDGFEVCRRLRASPAQAEIPIVLVTALDDRASRLTGLQAGADDFLGKPLDWAELRARVHHLTRFNRYRILLHERAQFEAALRVKTQQLQDLSRRLLEVQEAERRFLAAELHDDVGQVLTGLRLILELAARPDQPAPARQASLAQAQTLLQELTARVRALSLDLRPAMLDDFGLFAALEWLFERFTRQTHIAVRHNLNYRDERRFPRPVETAAFRIVQE